MQLTRLTLKNFTVFQDAVFEFAPGVNVQIGENGTGKSHVLKLIYSLTEAVRRFHGGQGLETGTVPTLDNLVRGMLMGVFMPDALENVLSRRPGQGSVSLQWADGGLDVSLGPGDALSAAVSGSFPKMGRPLFLPPREVLSIFPGFAAAWLHRESAFDRTYFDLCVALDLKPLRGGAPAALLDPIEQELDAKVVKRGDRFFLEYGGGDMEMPMVAEGDRKLAMIAYLLMNGSLSENAYLLWDEPEANLNPKRARMTGDLVTGLAHAGVQVFLATHDYALASELSLKVTTGVLHPGEAAFFSLHRGEGLVGVVVDDGETISELHDNPILDALASLHAREEDAFFASTRTPE